MDTQRLLERAVTAHQHGELEAAARQYRRVLEAEPNHPDALHLLGMIAHQDGDYATAAALIERAVSINPGFAQARTNLGHALLAQGKHAEAAASYRRALALGADPPEARLGLGMALAGLGQPAQALEAFQRVIALQPDNAAAHNQAGNALHSLGRLREARQAYGEAVRIQPGFAEAHLNLGFCGQALGDVDAAIASYGQAAGLRPNYAEAHNNLGSALQARRDFSQAIEAHQRAIAIKPDYADAHYNLGHALRLSGQPQAALSPYRRATRLQPETVEYWESLAACIAELPEIPVSADLLEDITRCLSLAAFDPAQLGRAVYAVIRADADLQTMLQAPADLEGHELATAVAALSKPLLMRFLERTHNTDPELEQLLVAIRRSLLRAAAVGRLQNAGSGLEFVCALSQQCFLNEYVLEESAEEARLVASLAAKIARQEGSPDDAGFALISCYRPLFELVQGWTPVQIERLEAAPSLTAIVRQQLTEPRLEAAMRAELPRETEVHNEVSQHVRAQYEGNPYPRWQHVTRQKARPMAEVLVSMFPALRHEDLRWPESPRILDAGCGTGKHTVELAMRFPEAEVLGLDLSLSSLAYAERKRRDLGIKNVRFAQADILEMTGGEPFHLIVSTGVLHHLADPVTGWRRLVDRLVEGGLMKIALYSSLARRPIEAARTRIEEWHLEGTSAGIRTCRASIMALPPGDPAREVITSTDFYTISRCRDLLFHVQESHFTLPQIAKIIDALKLTFLGFEFSDGTTLHRYRLRFPEDADATNLECWHEYELKHPDTFAGMYQLWVRKSQN